MSTDGTSGKAHVAVVDAQRALLEAAEEIASCRARLEKVGYEEWSELLRHIDAEIRGEVELLQKTLEMDKGGDHG